MSDRTPRDLGQNARRLRVRTLERLRWLALSGQTGAVLTVRFGLGFPLPLAACLLVIGALAADNVWLRRRWPQTHLLSEEAAARLLAFDVTQLASLIYLTGGLQNPFSVLFLAPVMIAAVSLSHRRSLYVGLFSVAADTTLARFHMPLPWRPGETFDVPVLYEIAIWGALASGTAFIGTYASRIADEARKLADALAATDLVLAREHHLSQVDGLAAAAAHELGTPLSTILLAAKELVAALGPDAPLREDAMLLVQEATRCRVILSRLSSLDIGDGLFDILGLGHMLETVVSGHRDPRTSIVLNLHGFGAEPRCQRGPGLLHGLGNLVENAVSFANAMVHVDADWTADTVTVMIRDDGPGFPLDLIARVGEPYISRRSGQVGEAAGGLGLGLFIAKVLLERSGAALAFQNASGGGACVRVRWPRSAFEAETTGV